jgi:hypothetical protein
MSIHIPLTIHMFPEPFFGILLVRLIKKLLFLGAPCVIYVFGDRMFLAYSFVESHGANSSLICRVSCRGEGWYSFMAKPFVNAKCCLRIPSVVCDRYIWFQGLDSLRTLLLAPLKKEGRDSFSDKIRVLLEKL